MSAIILETRGLTKTFGGLTAVSDVSLQVGACEVHAIIGPNGAGKSTMVNLLSGHLPPCDGQIIFKGQDITGTSPNRISHLGMGRSFQRTNIFPTFTCMENCWLAAQSRLKNSFRFFRRSESYAQVRERAELGLELCGLSAKREVIAGTMSYGEQRQLEIGMVLATEPSFLLLDEPMAGMGKDESSRVVELLARLSKNYSLVLVEHDMDAVFSIAHKLTVMVNGQMLASGPLDQVRNDPAVQEAYLGDGEENF
ncbi:branched-chain amino acid transport system ATP-binding protein [Pseudomonas linyingensis]|uniref:Branched-chain amino acid transport system ATP-binding protein n=1 Tax=Pseudomonas linyingensis TaxID=915471 RepID=A0A1H7D2H0_9PSED|nr:ABC transporter ATP-binding protein [Pseudomonas linyingensis]SEJ92325.1 branched-chain amino acid transport system ATP-binding protein [Pseudomonas linyingensis]